MKNKESNLQYVFMKKTLLSGSLVNKTHQICGHKAKIPSFTIPFHFFGLHKFHVSYDFFFDKYFSVTLCFLEKSLVTYNS